MVHIDFLKIYLKFVFLGEVAWPEYAALYVKFHHMNRSSIKDLNDVNFIQESFDDKCKYIDFARHYSIICSISTTRTS